MYGCETWAVKKAESQRINAFELWCWIRLLRVPCISRRPNQSILIAIHPEYSLEEMMLKLMLQYCGHLIWRTDHWKRPWCWERLKTKEKDEAEDDVVRQLHQLNGCEFEQTMGDTAAWYAEAHKVPKSQMQQSDQTRTTHENLYIH